MWGKDPERLLDGGAAYPLAAHHLDTALVAGVLWDTWLRPGLRDLLTAAITPGEPERARRIAMLVAAFHDVGKANPLFQHQAGDLRDLAWRPALAALLDGEGLGQPESVDVQHALAVRTSPARRHEYVGFAAVSGVFPESTLAIAEHWLAAVVGGHHGRWSMPDAIANGVVSRLMAGAWGEQQQAQVALSETAVGESRSVPALDDQPVVPVILLSGLLILADWIASDDAFVAAGATLHGDGLDPALEPSGWLAAREPQAAAHSRALVPPVTPLVDPRTLILGEHAPRPLQYEALAIGDSGGLWTVMYPTGEGKTEAALLRHSARPEEGLIFALPTRATTDAMDARLTRILSRSGNPVYLSHQFASAKPRGVCCEGDVSESRWFSTSIRRLIAPFVAATCDQILTGALTQRHAALRLLALANHHIVIDEIHTFDAYQIALVTELLGWLGATDTRVTLLSATLPEAKVAALRTAYAAGAARTPAGPYAVAYPSHNLLAPRTDVDQHGPADRTAVLRSATPAIHVELEWATDVPAALAAWARDRAARHPASHLAVVANTVAVAIDVARTLAARVTSHDVICLHSRMTLRHRNTIEQRLRTDLGRDGTPARPVIVVGSQVIEASLDIDFDLMASALAPAPSLIQRAGRLWRFGVNLDRTARVGSRRTLHVVCPETAEQPRVVAPTKALPYFASELARVVAHLNTTPVIRVPEDVQAFVETDRPMSMTDLVDAATELGAEQERLREAARSKAPLLTLLARRPAGRRRLDWADLAALTNLNDAEEVMRTRYIDAPSNTSLLFDSRGTATSPWVRTGRLDASILRTRPRQITELLAVSIPVGGRIARHLYDAHLLTLSGAGITAWEPDSGMLRGLLPVDLALAARHVIYDDLTGLTPLAEPTSARISTSTAKENA